MKIEINTRHQHTTKSLKPNFQGLIKRAQYQFAKREIEDILQMKLILSENCPRKIRDKEQSDVNEFFEWRLEKVSNCWLR